MKKLILIAVVLTVVACKKESTEPTRTVDIRTIAEGSYFSVRGTSVNYIDFLVDPTASDRMLVARPGEEGAIDTLTNIVETPIGFTCGMANGSKGSGVYDEECEAFIFTYYYELETGESGYYEDVYDKVND